MARYVVTVESDLDSGDIEESLGTFLAANGGSVVSVREDSDDDVPGHDPVGSFGSDDDE